MWNRIIQLQVEKLELCFPELYNWVLDRHSTFFKLHAVTYSISHSQLDQVLLHQHWLHRALASIQIVVVNQVLLRDDGKRILVEEALSFRQCCAILYSSWVTIIHPYIKATLAYRQLKLVHLLDANQIFKPLELKVVAKLFQSAVVQLHELTHVPIAFHWSYLQSCILLIDARIQCLVVLACITVYQSEAKLTVQFGDRNRWVTICKDFVLVDLWVIILH